MIKLLSSSAYLVVNKHLCKTIGLKPTILLADLLSKLEYFKTTQTLNNGWFFNTEKNIEQDTTLTPYQQRKALKILKEYNIIEAKRIGVPAKMHYKVNEEQVLKLFNNKLLRNLTTINKNKEIIINNNSIFKDEVFSYDFSKELLEEFYEYWTEPSKSGKLRYQMQKTWCTKRRLNTWAKRSKQFKPTMSKLDIQLNEYEKGKNLL